jgi:hypothetical protein
MSGCSRYQILYGTGGVINLTYYTCGDNTPVTLTATGGVSGAPYLSAGLVCGAGAGIIIASSVVTTVGAVSAGGVAVPGFVYSYPVAPWAEYAITNAVSAASGYKFI